jgi:acyl-CoA synthetase (AMP-forming)/AMP-acid ligase II
MDHPDRAAIIMATSGETVTYGEYEARCNQVAHFLRSAGLQRGDHISVFMENNPRLLEIAGGAERTGLYFTLINKYLAPDEVAYQLAVRPAVQLGSVAPAGRACRSEVPGAGARADLRSRDAGGGPGLLWGRDRGLPDQPGA